MADTNQARRLFLGCFVALVATAFGFAVRNSPQVLDSWKEAFDLTEEKKGMLMGVGLYPFAISIILLSLVVDRIGYGTTLAFAFVGHVASIALTIYAKDFRMLYLATFIYALANGAVEAVINPVVATIHRDNKTHWLNILHAGWPGGLVLGGLLSIGVLMAGGKLGATLPGELWQWQIGLLLIPVLLYGVLLVGMKFPEQERVEAGVSYRTMLEEFGWGSAYVVSFLIIMGVSAMLSVFGMESIKPLHALLMAIVPAAAFGFLVPTFGRPMFVFLTLVMLLLSTTELGTDGWIQDIMASALGNQVQGTLFLVYTSAIMFVLRFFAGPIVHRISPLGLLAACSAIAAAGLYWLGNAGTGLGVLFAAATLYGIGKTFFWPTTLGVVSEQYPKGGALLLNAISGIGMISIGTLGAPAIGNLQDRDVNAAVAEQMPAVHAEIAKEQDGLFFKYQALDKTAREKLTDAQRKEIDVLESKVKQQTLAKIAVLPVIMCVCYLILIAYFKARGGYKAEVLVGHAAEDEKFTGGTMGSGEG